MITRMFVDEGTWLIWAIYLNLNGSLKMESERLTQSGFLSSFLSEKCALL